MLPRKPNLSTRNLKLIYPFITVAKVRCVYVLPVCIYQILKDNWSERGGLERNRKVRAGKEG